MESLLVNVISISHILSFTLKGVLITNLFSLFPVELLTTLLSTTSASQVINFLPLFWSGNTSKFTQVSLFLWKGVMFTACRDEVFAPLSTLTLMAGKFNSGRDIHSS